MKYNVFTIDLNTALDMALDISGGFIYIKNATDLTVNIDVQYDNRNNDKINLTKSYGLVGKFNKLYLSASIQSGKTITVFVSDSYDSLRVFEQASQPDINTLATITNPVKIEPARNISTLARILIGTSATLLLANNTTRKRLLIKTLKTNSGYICIGSSAVTLTSGYILHPGEEIILEYSNALYAIAEIANDVLYILEEKE